MARSSAATPDAYIAELEPDRAALIAHVRSLVNAALPPGYRESMANGMIAWGIPLETYPKTYNGQPLGLAALAAQKNHNALYLMGLYMWPEAARAFEQAYADAGKKLDMGKSCLRFRKREDLVDDAISAAIASLSVEDYIRRYEAVKGR